MNRSLILFLILSLGVQAFVPSLNNRNVPRSSFLCLSETTVAEPSLEDNLALLKRAAETKQEDSEAVFDALSALEKQMRQVAREDPKIAESVLENLNGDWRLIFTTGTKDTQKRTGGRINYFPLKAVQSFRTDGMKIENGIYFGDFPALKFGGEFEFSLKSRKLEFDFNRVTLFGLFDIKLGQKDAAELGAKSGLGSKNNVTNKRKPFFNWISADDSIATARGGGGGLALWKRVE
ncbi:hypothetical protein FisN_13Lh233 [Fistulifera solaris]|uniref:Plastid lipid-associated protein/fibrillin conserved domain-containing protein n=1 Tax=Fistulifera solaris TaxID=1519565 RepID=A0A1Z5KMF9_FISSO|nr:hypothetical protein FisN_13Lh233 [Fistulifera solaris]|eukprot:GAX27211.1 hypothetical protein FisN_13Lh233 [Fistulifera solaris]